ncbi:mitochondrial structure specific endonuclease I (SSE-1), putative [Trypanosoma equiperdum]|uniref:Mitochondrial structure specific endonuclease I (SSE-1), putative n=4 Tax=Trypanozoon TaxID=39700 RepID=Q38CK4_TRYB2|nr:mitochondrial structure specific endonuclease I (SSE-1), putative [Trypanosoma brucei gambiense DAL972]XP_822294.1 mitochondrial structure specific endonuclease I (SSE-1), putative [Trypanosoma brucei brucei TREU927]RHW69893.1 mitochondrial structure specific endonuclease I (SSE-1) [Trypanosoma brucei equiperdum]SCU67049.1 mitochondrial structure specific endonuclease I (SSE-1), putative [Trypanosoma equiperdum]EAN77466.1 mitochondrial structure specific endonuclease I (SSE-1), putative [Try|eukprot:XP_011777211.1 mitochondrial structure specific endonuclease I (SSE-1), putative [Trypanosoma brucei gambiense DAL972]
MSVRERAVVLIDGPALIHRWYYRWLYTNRNNPVDVKRFAITNARHTIAIAHSFDPSHLMQHLLSPQVEYTHTPKHNKLIICFDQGDGGRREIYPKYKLNREGREVGEELGVIQKVATKVFLGEPKNTLLIVPHFDSKLKNVNAEADDMISTLAQHTQRIRIPTVIMSHDHDLYQLIDEASRCYYYDIRTKHLISEKGVIERLGVHPKLVRDYKCLAGDPSDNIPGVKGIGKTRALQLLKKYGDLEGVLTKGTKKQGGVVGDLLRAGVEGAELSRKLVELRDCPSVLRVCEFFLKL